MDDLNMKFYIDFYNRYCLSRRLETAALWMLMIATLSLVIYFAFGVVLINLNLCIAALIFSLFLYAMSKATRKNEKEIGNEEHPVDERRDTSFD